MGMSSRAKKRLFLLLAVAVVVGIALPGAYMLRRAQKRASVEQALAEGLAAHEAGNHAEAVRKLKYFIGNRRNNGEAYLALARSLSALPTDSARPLLEAAEYAKAAAARLEGDLEPRELVLDLYAKVGRINEALIAAREVLKVDPTNYKALALRTRMLITLRKWESDARQGVMGAKEAADELVAAYPDDPDAQIMWFTTRLASPGTREGERPQDLIARANELAQRDDDIRYAVIAAWVLERQDKPEEAASLLASRVVDLLDRPAALETLTPATLEATIDAIQGLSVVSSEHREDLDRAREHLLAAASRTPATAETASLILAREAWKNGNIDEARRWARTALEASTLSSDAALGWALLTDDGELRDTLVERLQTRGTPAADFYLAIHKAAQLAQDGRFDELEALVAPQIEEGPEPWLALYTLGRARLARGDTLGAIEAFEASIDPQHSPSGPWFAAVSALAETLAQTGRYDDAFEFAKLSLLFPDRAGTPGALLTSAWVLARSDALTPRDRDLLRQQADAWAQSPASSDWERSLAVRIAVMLNDSTRAINAARRLLESDNGEAMAEAARVLADIDIELARTLMDRALELSGVTPTTVYANATVLAREQGPSAGVAFFDSALADADDGARSELHRLRRAFLAEFLPEELEDDLIRLAEEAPDDAQAQLAALETPSLWQDRERSRRTIDRLRAALGDDAPTWRPYEARWILMFDPDRAEQIAELLRPLLDDPEPDQRVLVLAAEGKLAELESARQSDSPDPQTIARLRNEAIDLYERAGAMTSTDATIALRIAQALQRFGRVEEAGVRLDAIRRMRSLTREQRDTLAHLLANQGRFADAAEVFAEGLSENDGPRWARLAYLRARAGDMIGAMEAAERAALGDELAPRDLLELAVLYHRAGRESDAERLLARVGDAGEIPARRLRADYLERIGNLDEARALLEELASGDSPDDAIRLATFHVRHGDPTLAAKVVARALRSSPDDEDLRRLSDQLAVVVQEDRAVLDAVDPESWADSVPPDVRAVASVLRDQIDGRITPQQALDRLQNLTEIYPDSFTVWREMTRELLRQGRNDEALQAARRTALAMPANPDAAELATQAAIAAGKLQDALSLAQEWRSRSRPQTERADAIIAALHYQRNEIADAMQWVNRVREQIATETTPEDLALLVQILVAAGQAEHAWQIMQQRDPETILQSLAWLESEIARSGGGLMPPANQDWTPYEQWLDAIRDAMAALPSEEQQSMRRRLARVWHGAAIASRRPPHFQRVIDLLSDIPQDVLDARECAVLATCYTELGDFSAADRWYRASLAIEPENPLILNNLAYLQVRQGTTSDDSLGLINRAIEIADRLSLPATAMASLLDTKAHVLLALDRPEDALAVIAQIEVLPLPEMPSNTRLAKAEALSRLGREQEAREVLRTIDPAELSTEAQQRLASIQSTLEG